MSLTNKTKPKSKNLYFHCRREWRLVESFEGLINSSLAVLPTGIDVFVRNTKKWCIFKVLGI